MVAGGVGRAEEPLLEAGNRLQGGDPHQTSFWPSFYPLVVSSGWEKKGKKKKEKGKVEDPRVWTGAPGPFVATSYEVRHIIHVNRIILIWGSSFGGGEAKA